ncbi:MAG: TPM domain-containing protein [Ignavibacteria bacterium]
MSDNPTQLRQYAVDETGTLTYSQLNYLNNKLRDEEKNTSNQIVIYMIPSLNGESLEDVSIRLAEKNKIGKKDKNNGVLLLIVKNDKKVRLEVGYGLEGEITDAVSSQIIRNEITPSFKSGNFNEGINKGVDAIIKTINGLYTADKDSNDIDAGCCFGIPIFVVLIFGFIFVFIFMSFIKGILGIGRSVYSGKRGWNSGWGGGGFGGGFGGGGSGGGGGFSGGGGSFGGGGASGSW